MSSRNKSEKPAYEVRWFVSPAHRLELTHSLVAGLGALARADVLKVILDPLRVSDSKEGVLRWDVRETREGIERRIALEEFDRNDLFDLATLEEVDFYFKRNYCPQALLALPRETRKKILPSGVIFGCFTDGSRMLSARAALMSLVAEVGTHGLKRLLPALRRLFHNAEDIFGYLNLSTLERLPTDPLHYRVVFQTRIWPEDPSPDIDRSGINDYRIRIVRALQAEFGRTDLIGLLHTDYAKKTAPEALLSRKIRKREYAHQLRTSLIAVNSHGLDGSGGYKLGESLAAGCALVSQPFAFQFPEPFLPEVNYLPFQTPEECVAQCRRLLADRPLAERMRAANQEYYRKYVQPEAYVRRLLAGLFSAEWGGPCQGKPRPSGSGAMDPPPNAWLSQ